MAKLNLSSQLEMIDWFEFNGNSLAVKLSIFKLIAWIAELNSVDLCSNSLRIKFIADVLASLRSLIMVFMDSISASILEILFSLILPLVNGLIAV